MSSLHRRREIGVGMALGIAALLGAPEAHAAELRIAQRRRKKARDERSRPSEPKSTAPPASPPQPQDNSGRTQGLFGCFALLAVIAGFILWLSLRRKKAAGARAAWTELAQQLGWQFVPGAGSDVGNLQGMAGPVAIAARAGISRDARTGSYPYTRVTTTLPRALGGDFEISQKAEIGFRGKTGDDVLDGHAIVTGTDAQRIVASPVRDALLGYTAVTDRFGPIGPRTAEYGSSNGLIVENPAQLRAIIDAHVALANALLQTFPPR